MGLVTIFIHGFGHIGAIALAATALGFTTDAPDTATRTATLQTGV